MTFKFIITIRYPSFPIRLRNYWKIRKGKRIGYFIWLVKINLYYHEKQVKISDILCFY